MSDDIPRGAPPSADDEALLFAAMDGPNPPENAAVLEAAQLPDMAELDALAPLPGVSVVVGPTPVAHQDDAPPAIGRFDDEPDGPLLPPVTSPPRPGNSGDSAPSSSPRRQSRRTVKIPSDAVPHAAKPASVEPPATPPPPPVDDVIRPQRIISVGSIPPPRPAPDLLEKGWTPMPPAVEQAATLVRASAANAQTVANGPLASPTPEIEPDPDSLEEIEPDRMSEPSALPVPEASPTRPGEVARPDAVPDAAPTVPGSWVEVGAGSSPDLEIPDAAATIPGSFNAPWAPGQGMLRAPSDVSPPGSQPRSTPPAVVPGPPKVVIASAAFEPPLPPVPTSPYGIHDPETIDDFDVDHDETSESGPPSDEIPVEVDLGGPEIAPKKPPPPPPKRGPTASFPDIGAPAVPFPALPFTVGGLGAPQALPTSARTGAEPSPPVSAPPVSAPPGVVAAAVVPPDAKPAPASQPPEARKRARPWWEELFGDDFVRTMDRLEAKHVRKDADFIEERLALEKGAVILDLACGAGQHAVELAGRGYSVVGYDLSASMLARAADEAKEHEQTVNFLQGDMRDMAFEETFDGIYCWGTSFGYFDEEKNLEVLQRAHRGLRQGGMLLLDVTNRDYVAPRLPSLVWFEGKGCVCMDETYLDFFTSRLRVKRTAMFDDGHSREIDYSIRLYALHELGAMLHDAGYKVVEVTGHRAHPGVFFGTESPRIVIVAEKG